jgi:hypothetical protein
MADTHLSGLDVPSLKINGVQVFGTGVTPIPDYTITWTSNEPTAGDTATIADGTVPTVAELGQAVQDLTTKLNALLAQLGL